MKYIKTFEELILHDLKYYEEKLKNKLKKIPFDELNKVEIISPYLKENITNNTLYKVKTNNSFSNWYYKIRWYYRKPGYVNYCFLKADDGLGRSQFWIEEDKLMMPSEEEIELYLTKKNAYKYNL